MSIRLTGMASGLDTDSMVKELVNAYSVKLEGYEKDKTKIEWKQEKWKDLNTKVYGFYTGTLSSLRLSSSFSNKKDATISDNTKAKVSATSGAANGTQSVEIERLARAAYVTGDKVDTTLLGRAAKVDDSLHDIGLKNDGVMKITIGDPDGDPSKLETKEIIYSGADRISDLVDRIKEETGLSVSFDSTSQRFIIHSESGKKNDFTITAGEGEHDAEGLEALGLGTNAQKQSAEDSKIILNGATFIQDSNKLTVSGLTIEATGITSGPLTVNVATDKQGIYDMIKGFFKEYNGLVNEMTKNYNAENAKDYQPLTDDEKDEMSDAEIEKWENKIKDSLLRRDDTLNSILSAVTTAIMNGVEVNGKTYHLSDFGITTLGYKASAENEQNAYHIAGDKDDANTADDKDLLMKAIEQNPDLVTSFFTKMGQNVYDALHTKMLATSLRSAYTVYNDKELKDELKDIKGTISDWEKKVSAYEEKWYDKFAGMEKAMQELQSQTSQLTALLGQ